MLSLFDRDHGLLRFVVWFGRPRLELFWRDAKPYSSVSISKIAAGDPIWVAAAISATSPHPRFRSAGPPGC